jgi:hypothetical protein
MLYARRTAVAAAPLFGRGLTAECRGSCESARGLADSTTLSRGTDLSQFGRFVRLCSALLGFARLFIGAGRFSRMSDQPRGKECWTRGRVELHATRRRQKHYGRGAGACAPQIKVANRLLSAFTAFYRLSVGAGRKRHSEKTNQKPKRPAAISEGISVFPAFSRFFPVFRDRDPWGDEQLPMTKLPMTKECPKSEMAGMCRAGRTAQATGDGRAPQNYKPCPFMRLFVRMYLINNHLRWFDEPRLCFDLLRLCFDLPRPWLAMDCRGARLSSRNNAARSVFFCRPWIAERARSRRCSSNALPKDELGKRRFDAGARALPGTGIFSPYLYVPAAGVTDLFNNGVYHRLIL